MLAGKSLMAIPAREAQALEAAFDQFNEASTRLERKYQELLRETELLRAELCEKDKEVKRSERLALLGETATAIAHEVRNPLGAMRLFLCVLRDEVLDKPRALTLIQQIDTSVGTLDNLVTNILQFSRDRKLNFAPVNVHAIIQEVAAGFEPLLRPGAACECSLHGNPFIQGDDSALRRVIHNLAINSFQVTKYTGRLCIEVQDMEHDSLCIKVRDNGPGVPPELGERIFEPFISGRPDGTGLGLAIVKQLVVSHQGDITLGANGGAEFTIVLPRRQ